MPLKGLIECLPQELSKLNSFYEEVLNTRRYTIEEFVQHLDGNQDKLEQNRQEQKPSMA